MIYTVFAVIAISLDQWLKWWVSNNMALDEVRGLLPGLISLANVHNEGAAFGMFSGGRIWFILIAGFVCLLVIIALAADWIKNPLARWSAVFVAAGGVGNCIDRVVLGYVQDMFRFDFKILGREFPVFNIADIFITVFAFIFVICVLMGDKPSVPDEDEEDEDYDDDYDDEDDEDEAPVRSRRNGRNALNAAGAGAFSLLKRRTDDDDDEEEEDEDEDYYDYEDEEEEPRPSIFKRFVKEHDDVEDEDEDADIPPLPAGLRRNVSAPEAESDENMSKRAQKRRREEAFESITVDHKASAKAVKYAYDSFDTDDDPFDAWERANKKAVGSPASFNASATYKNDSVAAASPKSARPVNAKRPAPKKEIPEDFEFDIDTFELTSKKPAPAKKAEAPAAPARKPAPAPEKPAPAPEKPAAPAKKPAPAPASKPAVTADDEFDLDSILNEFK